MYGGKGNIDGCMSLRRYDSDTTEMKACFDSVIDWAASVFVGVGKRMRGLEWGRLYEAYHGQAYSAREASAKVREPLDDVYATDKKGIWNLELRAKLKEPRSWGPAREPFACAARTLLALPPKLSSKSVESRLVFYYNLGHDLL